MKFEIFDNRDDAPRPVYWSKVSRAETAAVLGKIFGWW